MAHTVTPLANAHCATGEGPVWHPDDGMLYWTDIPTGKLYRCDPDANCDHSGDYETVYEGDPVGGFTLQDDGDLLLFRVSDVALWSRADRSVRVVRAFDDVTAKRFNDVYADPAGRVYAGTMGATPEVGGLYRFDPDGTGQKLFAGTGTANGSGVSPDGRHFYWTDTTHRTIFRFAYDADTGDLSGRQAVYTAGEGQGHPDGLWIDVDGLLWSASYGGSAVFRIDPATGKIVDRVDLPTRAVTCPTFGGPGNDVLFVTTAEGKPKSPDPSNPAGTTYRVDGLGVRGLPRNRSRLR